jgi:hypothetical protein
LVFALALGTLTVNLELTTTATNITTKLNTERAHAIVLNAMTPTKMYELQPHWK